MKLIKTLDTVQTAQGKRVVYQGPRGGKYVKLGGKMVLLSTKIQQKGGNNNYDQVLRLALTESDKVDSHIITGIHNLDEMIDAFQHGVILTKAATAEPKFQIFQPHLVAAEAYDNNDKIIIVLKPNTNTNSIHQIKLTDIAQIILPSEMSPIEENKLKHLKELMNGMNGKDKITFMYY